MARDWTKSSRPLSLAIETLRPTVGAMHRKPASYWIWLMILL